MASYTVCVYVCVCVCVCVCACVRVCACVTLSDWFLYCRCHSYFSDLTVWCKEEKDAIEAESLADSVAAAEARLELHRERKVKLLHFVTSVLYAHASHSLDGSESKIWKVEHSCCC